MKTLFSAILASVLLTVCNLAQAQDTPPASRDTLYVNFLEGLDKGDTLPFKYIYQRARIGVDTTITCSVSKDIELEVIENDKENQIVHFTLTQTNFHKEGPESNNPHYLNSTFLLGDGYPVSFIVSYSGKMGLRHDDTLFSRHIKNVDYITDTLLKSPSNKLTKEQWDKVSSRMKDTNYIAWKVLNDIEDLFFFGAFDYEPNVSYSMLDSMKCGIDNKSHSFEKVFGWDKAFSDENETFRNMYVFRYGYHVDGLLFLERLYNDSNITLEKAEELMKKADPKRCGWVVEMTELADRAMGLPVLLEKQTLDGYYEEIGDNYIRLAKETIILDLEKLMAQEGDDDEDEEEDGQPRYDDYGFIKVK